jgi:hypothetical protein
MRRFSALFNVDFHHTMLNHAVDSASRMPRAHRMRSSALASVNLLD